MLSSEVCFFLLTGLLTFEFLSLEKSCVFPLAQLPGGASLTQEVDSRKDSLTCSATPFRRPLPRESLARRGLKLFNQGTVSLSLPGMSESLGHGGGCLPGGCGCGSTFSSGLPLGEQGRRAGARRRLIRRQWCLEAGRRREIPEGRRAAWWHRQGFGRSELVCMP